MDTILSILLAFFSISISILFYFNADKAGKDFYNSSYTFMKEQSQLLGEINIKFGEKFDNLSLTVSSLKEQRHESQNKVEDSQSGIIVEQNRQIAEYKEKVLEMETELQKQGVASSENKKLKEIINEIKQEQAVGEKRLRKYEEQLMTEREIKRKLERELLSINRNRTAHSTINRKYDRAELLWILDELSEVPTPLIREMISTRQIDRTSPLFLNFLERDFITPNGQIRAKGLDLLLRVANEREI